jgi:hypothetical protein
VLLLFSLFTTCFDPYGPSSGEIQLHHLHILKKSSILQRMAFSKYVSDVDVNCWVMLPVAHEHRHLLRTEVSIYIDVDVFHLRMARRGRNML